MSDLDTTIEELRHCVDRLEAMAGNPKTAAITEVAGYLATVIDRLDAELTPVLVDAEVLRSVLSDEPKAK
jgi:hypothetical protein